MGRVVLQVYLTVDGVYDGEGRASLLSWNPRYFTPEFSELVRDQLRTVDALLLGRKTFEGFASSWPSRQPQEPRSEWTADDEIADRLNALPKYVASRTLQGPLEWNGTVLQGGIPDAVTQLKEQMKGDILIYGGGEFVHALTRRNLIDEYHLVVFPIVVGAGERLFKDDADLPLRLVYTKTLSSGVIDLCYQPAT